MSNGGGKKDTSQLDKNGYCSIRNSPLDIPSFYGWNINITEPIQFTYQDSQFPPVIINGNKLEFKIEDTSKINYAASIYQQEFKLDHIFIVSPSFHTINDKAYDLEMQFTFKLDNKLENKVAINLLMDEDRSTYHVHDQNSLFFKPIMNAIKRNKEIFVQNRTAATNKEEIVTKADESHTTLHEYFAYLGSTVLPPCTGTTEIPQIVIDVNAQMLPNEIFMNPADIKVIKPSYKR